MSLVTTGVVIPTAHCSNRPIANGWIALSSYSIVLKYLLSVINGLLLFHSYILIANVFISLSQVSLYTSSSWNKNSPGHSSTLLSHGLRPTIYLNHAEKSTDAAFGFINTFI